METGIDLDKMIIAGQFVNKLVNGKGTDSYIQRIETFKRMENA